MNGITSFVTHLPDRSPYPRRLGRPWRWKAFRPPVAGAQRAPALPYRKAAHPSPASAARPR